MKERNLILRYDGDGIRDNSIDVDDLIYGLKGIVKLSSTILNEYDPKIVSSSSLRVKGFKGGSFETVLMFIESHPVLIGNATAVLIAVSSGLAWWFTRKEKPSLDNDDSNRVLEAIIKDDKKRDDCMKSLYLLSIPLKSGRVDVVDFGLEGNLNRLIDKSSMHHFEEHTDEFIHKPIEMQGYLRSLDKKTLNGKFTTNEGLTYPIKLVMDEPEKYFIYFNENSIRISGVATYETGDKSIKKIEINYLTNSA